MSVRIMPLEAEQEGCHVSESSIDEYYIRFEASGSEHWFFYRWGDNSTPGSRSGGESGIYSADSVIVMPDTGMSYDAVAYFAPYRKTVTIGARTDSFEVASDMEVVGTTQPPTGTYDIPDTREPFEAHAENDNKLSNFTKWISNESDVRPEPSPTISFRGRDITRARTYTAMYRPVSRTITVQPQGTGQGRITMRVLGMVGELEYKLIPRDFVGKDSLTFTFPKGDMIFLTAEADNGSIFVRWDDATCPKINLMTRFEKGEIETTEFSKQQFITSLKDDTVVKPHFMKAVDVEPSPLYSYAVNCPEPRNNDAQFKDCIKKEE